MIEREMTMTHWLYLIWGALQEGDDPSKMTSREALEVCKEYLRRFEPPKLSDKPKSHNFILAAVAYKREQLA